MVTEQKRNDYVKKLALLGPISGRASAGMVKQVAELLAARDVEQLNVPDKPFHKPYGNGYTGADRSPSPLYYYSTYDGCRTWSFNDGVLTITIMNGDSIDGCPTNLRGQWEFKFHTDWWYVEDLVKTVDRQWILFLDQKLEDMEREKHLLRRKLLEEVFLTEKA